MAARSVWKGHIRFGLVSMPVKAYSAANSQGSTISLNQLHKDCNHRINYQKTCPVHGKVPADEIVSGYQFAKDQYVVIDTNELEKLRTPRERAIDITAFISPGQIDPSYFSGKSYYLLPDAAIAQKPYVLLQRLMVEEKKAGVAQVVLFGHEQVVLVRAVEDILMMSPLSYSAEMRKPKEFADEVPHADVNPAEMKIARSLLMAMTPRKFDFGEFKDVYGERLRKLVDAKVAGMELAETAEEQMPPPINLMDALRKSIEHTASGGEKAAKPQKLAAPSVGAKQTRRRKTS